VVVVVVMGDMGARRTKTFLWVLLLLHQAFNLVVFFFTWFAAVGVGPNSGPLDPDVIKWLLLPGLIFCFVLFLVALLAGTFRDNTKWRQNAHTWFYAEAVFFLLFLTVWAWIWDSRFESEFPGGSPVIPASDDPAFVAKLKAFIEWKVIVLAAAIWSGVILGSGLHLWRTMLQHDQAVAAAAAASEPSIPLVKMHMPSEHLRYVAAPPRQPPVGRSGGGRRPLASHPPGTKLYATPAM